MAVVQGVFVMVGIVCITSAKMCEGMHVTGSWSSDDGLYYILGVFGFQTTDSDMKDATMGRVYGNITSTSSSPVDFTLLLLDDRGWNNFARNVENSLSESEACSKIFDEIEGNVSDVFDQACNPEGNEDVFRFVPCPIASACRNQKSQTVDDSQFTFNATNYSGPQYWRLAVVSCCHDNLSSANACLWHPSDPTGEKLSYDVWFVNGDPDGPHNLFYYQFSFELQGVLVTYTVLVILFLPLLTVVSIAACGGHTPSLVKILNTCIVVEYVGTLFYFTHLALYSQNGIGQPGLQVITELLVAVAQCLLVLLLLLLASGWSITVSDVGHKQGLGIIWATYCLFYFMVFLWQVVKLRNQDVDKTVDAWESWPGFTLVALRLCILLPCFIYQLRTSYNLEAHQLKLKFYRQLGMAVATWFCYLPALVIALSAVSELWRDKIFQGVTLSTDFFFYCVLVYLLWPTKSKIYFKLSSEEHQHLLQESQSLKDPASNN